MGIKKIWKIIFLAVMFMWGVSLAHTAVAEPGAEPKVAAPRQAARDAQGKDPAARHLENLTRRLGLSAEQQEQIKPVLKDEAARLAEIRADAKLSVADKKGKVRELRDATLVKIRPLLTPEQQKKHDEQMKDIMERRRKLESKGAAAAAPVPAK